MNKIILISGSNRSGNTEYILKRINNEIDSSLILLKDKSIDYCRGCLACHHIDKCIINDDINEIINNLVEAKLVVFGVPNYFDNVSGLFKNFMDRLHPLYKSNKLRGKEVVFIYVGGGKEIGTKENLHQAIKGFVKYLGLDLKEEFSLKALNISDARNCDEEINNIIFKIKNYI